MQKKIPGYFVQKNVQDQLMAAGYVFDAVRDITGFARKRGDDREIQEFFHDVAQRLLSMGESLKDSASAVGDKARTSTIPVTLIKDSITRQFRYSQQIFRIVGDIAKFGKSRHTDRELLEILEVSARNLNDAGEMLSSSASETGDQLLHSIEEVY
jgi:hypothetical protein